MSPGHQLSDAKRMLRPCALSLVPPSAELEFFGPMKDGLAESVISGEEDHRMAGVLPASTIMIRRLQAQGYVEGNVVEGNPVAATGKTIRGHEFHYSRMDCARDARFVYRFTMGP